MTEHIELRLELLDSFLHHGLLREFACWMALQTSPALPSWRKAVEHILDNVNDDLIGRICYVMKERMQGAAVAAGVIGVRRSPVAAFSILACAACYHDDAKQAAKSAVINALAWYEAVTEQEDTSAFVGLIEGKLDAIWTRSLNDPSGW